MLLVDSLAEEQIQAAIRRGEFDDLPGSGQPLALDDDAGVPDELRVAYRILRNAGCLPPELTLRNEIHQLESLLDQAELAAEQRSVRRRLCLLKARLAMQGHEGDLLIHEQAYRERLIDKLSRRETEDIPDLQADR
ncbi:MAG: DUF1992 domain-containing protein [Gammaproteobacteria bacterium]|jgi:hypothetical protein|nr:DUF1992 domain-containing protein [Gammaproteobacteria bacterium]